LKRNTYFTSDWHIGHNNCLEFDKRPFKNINHMHTVLINNYNASVKVNDVCYFVGDVGLCKDSELIMEIIGKLNGTKVLVIGNHDKSPSFMGQMFDVVLNGVVLTIAKERVTISHCPLMGLFREDVSGLRGSVDGEGWHGESRPKNRLLSFKNEGQFHLHGHVHAGPLNPKSNKIENKQYDIGVVGNDYRPVSISQIESWICKYKNSK